MDEVMQDPATTSNPKARRPRLLWANAYCLLDTSSGASMTIREMLMQLAATMIDVRVLGATNFDSDRGTNLIKTHPHALQAKPGEMLVIRDGKLVHNLFVTANITRGKMAAREEMHWHMRYVQLLMEFKPDLVFFYGGYPLDFLVPDEARSRGVPSAAYIANGNYHGTRWCRDVDLILTDSEATASLYDQWLGLKMNPVGKFINQDGFVAKAHTRKNLLFVNPSPTKGVGVVLRLAAMLRKRRPDILIEVVESRGKWSEALAAFRPVLGREISDLPNVTVTPHATDMRPIYGRARVLLAPSLWWESSGRVLAEAMLNGIPAVVTNRGGMPEMVRDGGVAIDLPQKYFIKPFMAVPEEAELEPFMNAIIEMFDDEEKYKAFVANARRVGEEQHHISVSTRRLMSHLKPLLDQRAGDNDFPAFESLAHRQGRPTITRPAS
jgi:glycosyltransferase involved in cell wall biosynthesis